MLIRDMNQFKKNDYDRKFNTHSVEHGLNSVYALKSVIADNALSIDLTQSSSSNGRVEFDENGDLPELNYGADVEGFTLTQKQTDAVLNDINKIYKMKDSDMKIIFKAHHSSRRRNVYYFTKTQVLAQDKLSLALDYSKNFIFKLSNDYVFSHKLLSVILNHHQQKRRLIMSKDIKGHERLQNLALKHLALFATDQEDCLEKMGFNNFESILGDKILFSHQSNTLLINLEKEDALPAQLFTAHIN